MALGATAAAVRRLIVSQGARVVLIGVVIGVGVALVSTRLLGTLLYGVKAADPIVFAAMSLMMLAIGLLASYVPAHRASSVHPIESLRSD
jgi:putative ABC transport system permease protein